MSYIEYLFNTALQYSWVALVILPSAPGSVACSRHTQHDHTYLRFMNKSDIISAFEGGQGAVTSDEHCTVSSDHSIEVRINTVDRNNWWISFLSLLLLNIYPIFWEVNTCMVFMCISSKTPCKKNDINV